jgi:hypothetical protein
MLIRSEEAINKQPAKVRTHKTSFLNCSAFRPRYHLASSVDAKNKAGNTHNSAMRVRLSNRPMSADIRVAAPKAKNNPRTMLKVLALIQCRLTKPKGIPKAASVSSGRTARQLMPLFCEKAAYNSPAKPALTAKGTAKAGSRNHTQMAMATMENTKPATP